MRKPRSDRTWSTDEERKAQRAIRAKKYRDNRSADALDQWHKYSRSEKGRVQALLSGAQQRASKKGLPFDLDKEFVSELLSLGSCSITGIPFDYSRPEGCNANPFTPSLDRVVPQLGYVKTNVRAVCFAVNAAKQDWSDEVLLQVASAIVTSRTRV